MAVRLLREQDPDQEQDFGAVDDPVLDFDVEAPAEPSTEPSEMGGEELTSLLTPETMRTQFEHVDSLLTYLKQLGAALSTVRSQSYDHGPDGEDALENTVSLASAEQSVTDLQIAALDMLSRLQTLLGTQAPQWVEYANLMGDKDSVPSETTTEEPPAESAPEEGGLPTDDELKFEGRKRIQEVAIYGVTDPNQLSLKAVANLMLIYLRSKQAAKLNAELSSFKATSKADVSKAQKTLASWLSGQFGPMLRWWRDEIAAKSGAIIPEVMNVLVSAGSASALTPSKMGSELSRTQTADQEASPGIVSKDNPAGIAPGQEITGESLVLRQGKWWLKEEAFDTLAEAFMEAVRREIPIADVQIDRK